VVLGLTLLAAAGRPAPAWAEQPSRAPLPPPPPGDVLALHAAAPFGPRQVTLRDEQIDSPALGRPLKYRVALPPGYERATRRYPALYLLHGLTGDYRDWEGRADLARHLREHALIVVMPDAGNSWYVDAADGRSGRYERAIGLDLVNAVDARYRTLDAPYARAVAGLSMGGYGALKFALKHPQRFAFAGSLSGALGAAHVADFADKFDPSLRAEFERFFGPPGGETRAANDVFALAARADPARLPFLYLDCGSEDGLLEGNREFVKLLQSRGIAYEYRELPGAHTWDYWNRQVRALLQVLAERIPQARREP
jgi:S-formylglutathione hydrolase FrmB